MSWKIDNSGGPKWSGMDSIYNMKSDLRWLYLGGGIAGLLLCAVTMGGTGSTVDNGLNAVFGVLVLMPSIGITLYGLTLFPKWINDGWALTANSGYLYYRGENSWSVHLNHIGSVEVGRAVDWTPARSTGLSQTPVSPYEWQVFLFLTNGSRRVIYSVNADRESAATLAASIKSWADRQRVDLPKIIPVSDDRVAREGFAL
jgi:hypothetical protein